MARAVWISLLLAFAVGAAAVGLHHLVAPGVSARLSAGPVTLLTVGLPVVIASLVLQGLALALTSRSAGRLARRISEEAAAERPGTIGAGGVLSPVASAATSALSARSEREQRLAAEARELRIRHRVAETERQLVVAVLDALRDGVLVTNAFDEVVMANAAAARDLAFRLEIAMRRPVAEVVADLELCQLIRDVREAGPGAQRTVEHAITGSDRPERMLCDIALSSVRGAHNDSAGVVTVLHDLTREREVSQLKTDFVAKASHELRTPLTSIRAYIEMLLDGEAADEESRVDFYKIIRNESDRLGRLIDNMLNISRIEAGILQVSRTLVDMKGVLARAVETLSPQAQEKKITLISRISDVDLTVEGDEDMLYQVALNLLSNAVKYTPEGGRVTVTADSENLTRTVVFSVADTGLGIPPDSIDRVFEKFFRIENYSRIAKGTGLGLNLCKHIIETVHRGQIEVESKLGLGSRFTCSIPMRYAGLRTAA
ncbi:MAG: hypothetical protein KF817_11205 [Phycisphaeraceae bacterium]|nr:hypothetical protein [Phycisphaeraceae bacterium]